MFDAYTIKKVLPRLVAAIILIQLSWFIFTSMVSLTNIVSYGIEALIMAPFGGVNVLTDNPLSEALKSTGLGSGGYFVAFAGGVAGAGALLATSLGVFAVTALVVGFLVLAIRRVMLIALILISPIALVAWILPGTQRFWKMWWDNFSKLLLMFPLIVVMVSAGAALAQVVGQSGAQNDIISIVLIFACIFAPFFLIPKTYNMAGMGLAATAGWIAGKASKGEGLVGGYLGNRRKKRWGDRLERAKNDNFFKGGTERNLRGRLNRGIAGAALIPQAGLNPMQMRNRMRSANMDEADVASEEFAKNNVGFGRWSGDDAKLSAARFTDRQDIADELARFDEDRFGGDSDANKRRREDAVTQIMRSQRETSSGAFDRARIRAMAKTGTGYQTQDADGNTVFDAAAMIEDINRAYGDDRNGAGRALAEMRSSLTNSGQVAGAAGFGTWGAAMEGMKDGSMTRETANDMVIDNAIDSATPGQAIFGKPSSAATLGKAHAKRIQKHGAALKAARASGDTKAATDAEKNLAQAVAAAAGVRDAMAQASPNNAKKYAEQLMSQDVGVDFAAADGTPIPGGTVRDFIDAQMAGNSDFVDMRRDLGQSTLDRARAEAANAAAQAASQAGGFQPGAGGPPQPPMGGPPPSPF